MTSTTYSTFWVAGLLLGLEVDHVQEVLRDQRVTPVPLAYESVLGLMNLRGQLATTVDARRRLGQAADEAPGNVNVIIRTGTGPVNLVVDAEGEVMDLDTGALEEVPQTVAERLRGFLSGVHDIEGRLLLVLDVNRVVDLSDS